MKNRGFALHELFVTIILIVIAATMISCAMFPIRSSDRRQSCANNLKQFGLVFKMFANESVGNKYPHLQIDYSIAYNDKADGQHISSKGGPDSSQIYPLYLMNVSIGDCPEDVNGVYALETITYPVDNTLSENEHSWCNDLVVCEEEYVQFTRKRRFENGFSYVYMPKFIQSEWIADPDDNATLAQLYSTSNTVLNRNDDIAIDLTGVGSSTNAWNAEVTLLHLHEGIERFLITDINALVAYAPIQSVIPIMWDPVISGGEWADFNHIPGGSNVLYMDGHVSFVKYPASHTQATWPLSRVSVDKQSDSESW